VATKRQHVHGDNGDSSSSGALSEEETMDNISSESKPEEVSSEDFLDSYEKLL
jgi:hypothetical protein